MDLFIFDHFFPESAICHCLNAISLSAVRNKPFSFKRNRIKIFSLLKCLCRLLFFYKNVSVNIKLFLRYRKMCKHLDFVLESLFSHVFNLE